MVDFNLNDNIQTKEEAEFAQNVDLMKNRRRMAYFSLFATAICAILLILALIIHPQLLDNYPKAEGTLGTIILGWFSVIALYFGAASLAEVFGNKIK
jgi:ABC-type multidrug transport system fused ATPase/permease subunit